MIDGHQFSLMRPESCGYLLSTKPKYEIEKGEHENIPEEEVKLASHEVMGFSLSSKQWGFFKIEMVHDIRYNEDAFGQLILPKLQKDMVKALVTAHEKGKLGFDDIIKGKGKGMAILLHGTPGVGKTLTAGN